MLQSCVVERGTGGIAFNLGESYQQAEKWLVVNVIEGEIFHLHMQHVIGGDNKVNVAIADYKPNVQCDTSSTPGPPLLSCFSVFSNMRATTQLRLFGYPNEGSVDEQLPLVLEAGKCHVEPSGFYNAHKG